MLSPIMDCISVKDQEFVIDIDVCPETSKEVGSPPRPDPLSLDETVKGDVLVSIQRVVDDVSPGSGQNGKREKRKLASGKKPPKPPRPPRGLSLDAADQKLIREITELAMIKRARVERMKALKKLKAAKASSTTSSSSSSGSWMAMVFTIIFCIVIILQGCHSGISPGSKPSVPIVGSSDTNGVFKGDTNLAQSMITDGVPLTSIGSPNVAEKAIH